jgi:hypothetical protein
VIPVEDAVVDNVVVAVLVTDVVVVVVLVVDDVLALVVDVVVVVVTTLPQFRTDVSVVSLVMETLLWLFVLPVSCQWLNTQEP